MAKQVKTTTGMLREPLLCSTIALSCCSDSRTERERSSIEELCQVLDEIGLTVSRSRCLYEGDVRKHEVAADKAAALMELYADPAVQMIFDISGGDLASELLDHLDYERIAGARAVFAGYSDLTCLLNAIYYKTGQESWLYQIRNLVSADRKQQQADFKAALAGDEEQLCRFSYQFIQGKRMEGIMIGGNIRCFLKLAGTEYMPDFSDKILFLEALSGNRNRIAAMFAWLRQMGVFDKVNGIVLGTFTELDKSDGEKASQLLIQALEGRPLPIAVTREIGHGSDAKCLKIGARYQLADSCLR